MYDMLAFDLNVIAETYRRDEKLPPLWTTLAGDSLAIDGPYEDEDGELVRVGFNLPPGMLAEIDDGTYGTLQAFRIYKEVDHVG